jgi:PST family polysaccharide transporter
MEKEPHSRSKLIAHGIFWNSGFQVFLVAVNFVSMLVLVRIIAPAEYGRATAATGILAVLNCFNCSSFIAQAIQLGGKEEPDWQSHWRAGFYIQLALTLLCNAVAGLAWLFPAYRPFAPLLHLASLGLLVDTPNQISLTMMRRDMNFRRLRLTNAVAVLVTAIASIALGLKGAGAYALIIGSNVVHGLPFGCDLLFVRKWRPAPGWWRWPDWTGYRKSLRFGGQMSAVGLLTVARGMLESLVLPKAIGYEAIGLLNRAQVLFATTFGRVVGLILDVVYPLLPRSADDPVQFARHATLVAQAMLLFSIPGAVFVAFDGTAMSRLLYGAKWVAADPLIFPGTILAWSLATALVFGTILLTANRLKLSLILSIITAGLSLPALLVAAFGSGTLAYIWALAAGQCIAVLISGMLVSRLLETDWVRRAVVPPLVAAIFGGAALFLLASLQMEMKVVMRLLFHSAVFGVVVATTVRLGFPAALRTVIARLPRGERWNSWLKLNPATAHS